MKTISFALLVSLAACGGGSTDECKSTVSIQLFGDSTQLGARPPNAGGTDNPEQILQTAMDAALPGRVKVTTRAVGSTDSQQLRTGTDTLNPPWPQGVTADIVLMNHGHNDNGRNSVEQYKDNLRAFARSNVIFETQLPNTLFDPISVAQFDSALRSVVAETGSRLIDVRAYALSRTDWSELRYDNVHPNEAGQQALANDVIAPALIPIARSMLCD